MHAGNSLTSPPDIENIPISDIQEITVCRLPAYTGTKKDCQEMFPTARQYYKFFNTPDNTNLNPKLIKAKSICCIYPLRLCLSHVL